MLTRNRDACRIHLRPNCSLQGSERSVEVEAAIETNRPELAAKTVADQEETLTDASDGS